MEKRSDSPSQDSEAPVAGSLGRVLVIEDDPDVSMVLEFALQQAGATEVETAADGPTGLARALAWVPDLILCDLMMPGLDGIGVCAALRASVEAHDVPLIFVTAYGATAFRDRDARSIGARGVLLKPFRVQTLGDEIRRILALE